MHKQAVIGRGGDWAQLKWHLVDLATSSMERQTLCYTWPCTWGMHQICHVRTSRALGFVNPSTLAVINTNSMQETARCCFGAAMLPRARADAPDAQPLQWSDDGSMFLVCVEAQLLAHSSQAQRQSSPWAIQLRDAASGSMLIHFPMPQIPGGCWKWLHISWSPVTQLLALNAYGYTQAGGPADSDLLLMTPQTGQIKGLQQALGLLNMQIHVQS